MQVIEVTNPVEARRARLSQFQSRTSVLQLAGQTVLGNVQSVMPVPKSDTPKWIVRIVPKPSRVAVPRTVLTYKVNKTLDDRVLVTVIDFPGARNLR